MGHNSIKKDSGNLCVNTLLLSPLQELARIETEEAGLERAAGQQEEAAHAKEDELKRMEQKQHQSLDQLTCVLTCALINQSPESTEFTTGI